MDKKIVIIGSVAAIIVIALVIGIVLGLPGENSDGKVTYDCQGGTIDGQGVITYSEKNFVELSPSKNGYAFEGWYKDKDNWTGKVNNGDPISSSITVYAKWAPDYTLMVNSYIGTTGANVFAVMAKNGAQPFKATFYDLPDSGTTKIVATSGSQFTVIKYGTENKDCLRYKVDDKYFYAKFNLNGAKTVTYGVDADTHRGYVEFTYDSNIYLGYTGLEFAVVYDGGDGVFSDTGKNEKKVSSSLTYLSDTTLQLDPPAGKTFAGWYTEETGGTQITVGSNISYVGSDDPYITVYAHYNAV